MDRNWNWTKLNINLDELSKFIEGSSNYIDADQAHDQLESVAKSLDILVLMLEIFVIRDERIALRYNYEKLKRIKEYMAHHNSIKSN